MKRISIVLAATVGICILFTGCNSVFLGDTSVDMPTQSEIYVPSAQTGYRDVAGMGKFMGDGEDAFYFMEGHSKNSEDIIQFLCLDYIEEKNVFVYAYQTMLSDGSGKMVTELLSYNPYTREGTEFFSQITDPNVEPTMFAQRVELDGSVRYFIYFGGYGTFFLSDGTIYNQQYLKPAYMDIVNQLGNIKDLTILSANVYSTSNKNCVISMNFVAERTEVNEDTEWTDDMKESDTLPMGEGEEAGSVNFRINYSVVALEDYYLEKRIARGKDGEGGTDFFMLKPGIIFVSNSEGFVKTLSRGQSLEGMVSTSLSARELHGFIDHVEDIVEEVEHEDESTGETTTEEQVVGQRAYMTTGSYASGVSVSYTTNTLASGGYGKRIAYNGSRCDIGRENSFLDTFSGIFSNQLDSEIQAAGPAIGGGIVLITQKYAYFESGNSDNKSSKLLEIPLSAIRFDINLEIDTTSRSTKTAEEETTADPQRIEMTHAQETQEIPTGVHEEGYTKEDEQLFDKLNPQAVEQGGKTNLDSAQAGIKETNSYDKEQMEQDGVVVGNITMNPDVDVNPDMYRPESFMEYQDGLLISSLNSGIVYFNERSGGRQIFGYPIFRTWRLENGGFVAVGFDDNSKRYLDHDLPFAKVFYFELDS